MIELRRIVPAVIMIFIVLVPLLAMAPTTVHAQRKALILSSIEGYSPMAYARAVRNRLALAGYEVTFINDTGVTLDLLTTQLNTYDVVIWRTDVYQNAHVNYWYVGQLSNQTTMEKYSADFSAGRIDNSHSALGISLDFMRNHFRPGSLENVTLAVLISSKSVEIADVMIRAGVQATVDFYGNLALTFSLIDYVTSLVVDYLARGSTVKTSVVSTVDRFISVGPDNPLDNSLPPPVWYLGDGTVTISNAYSPSPNVS